MAQLFRRYVGFVSPACASLTAGLKHNSVDETCCCPCRALLQQEQARHDTVEEQFLEQNRRAATVNTELIKTNSSLRQQLRAMKAQVRDHLQSMHSKD